MVRLVHRHAATHFDTTNLYAPPMIENLSSRCSSMVRHANMRCCPSKLSRMSLSCPNPPVMTSCNAMTSKPLCSARHSRRIGFRSDHRSMTPRRFQVATWSVFGREVREACAHAAGANARNAAVAVVAHAATFWVRKNPEARLDSLPRGRIASWSNALEMVRTFCTNTSSSKLEHIPGISPRTGRTAVSTVHGRHEALV